MRVGFCAMESPAPSGRLRARAVLRDPLVHELLTARLVAVLATYDPVGTIHAVPMWYATRDGSVVLATSSRSRKVTCLEADPRATLVLHDSRSGYEVCGASIAGTVEIVMGADARTLVGLVHERYLTSEAGDDPSVSAYLASDDVALRFRPESATTWDERASEAARALRSSGGALPLAPTDPRPRIASQ